mmetsp:Transcript_24825/g.36411  ORF Transcript_24825/g.36411 Transcript_24825/m.36411 type:complete len:442 (+) Transcript_24825:1062-2387(+)
MRRSTVSRNQTCKTKQTSWSLKKMMLRQGTIPKSGHPKKKDLKNQAADSCMTKICKSLCARTNCRASKTLPLWKSPNDCSKKASSYLQSAPSYSKVCGNPGRPFCYMALQVPGKQSWPRPLQEKVARASCCSHPAACSQNSSAKASACSARSDDIFCNLSHGHMPSLKPHLISCVIKYSVILIHAYAKVFAFAKQNAPAVIFIDEVDAFGMDRDGQSEPGLRRLMTEMLLQFNSLGEKVVVVAATNRIQDIDAALLRRFERKIEVGLLGEEQRATLLRLKMKGTPMSREIDLGMIARHTRGYSGAELELLCREAAMYGLRELLDSADESVFLSSSASVRPVIAEDFMKACGVIKSNTELTQANTKQRRATTGRKRAKNESPTESDCSFPNTPSKTQELEITAFGTTPSAAAQGSSGALQLAATQVQVKQEYVKEEKEANLK